MDRIIVYPQEQMTDVQTLTSERNTMIGLGKLAGAVMPGIVAGVSPSANGLVCSPQGTPNLTVQIGMGELYSLYDVDATAYGSLTADTTDVIVKQAIQLGSVTLPTSGTFTAPATSGQSINYLIEAQYADSDTGSTVLQYYNAANWTVPLLGPGGGGSSQYTTRTGIINYQIKAGTAATTGTQTTPAPDSGYVGLWVVTVAHGQTSITSSSIAPYPSAPFHYKPLSTWNSTQAYPTNAYVQYNGATYLSLSANYNQNPASATTYWQRWGYTSTQILNAAGFSFQNVYAISSTGTLSLSQCGSLLVVTGGGTTQTLPAVSTVSAGLSMILLAQYAYAFTNPTTIAANGGDTITGLTGGTSSSFALYGTELVVLTSTGSSWEVTNYIPFVPAHSTISLNSSGTVLTPFNDYGIDCRSAANLLTPMNAWSATNSTITANVADIFGGTNAITNTRTSSSFAYINSNLATVLTSNNYTVSVFLKQGTATASQIQIFNASNSGMAAVQVNWSGGVGSVGTTSNASNVVLTSQGNGWYRLSYSFSTSSNSSVYVIGVPDAVGTTGSTTFYNAQLYQGTTFYVNSPVQVQLPANPTDGMWVDLFDEYGSFSSTNYLLITQNGSPTIMGLAQNMSVYNTNIAFRLRYSSAINDWRVK